MDLLATSEDLRNFLGKEEIDRARADLFLAGISSEVRKYAQQSFEKVETDTISIDGSGHSVVLLPSLPVNDIASVSEGGAELTDGTDFEWSHSGILRRLSTIWTRKFRNIEVTYEHGHDYVPDDVRLLVIRVAARGFVNPTGTTNESMGGYSAGYGFDTSRMPQLTEADRQVLHPYMGR